MKILVYGAVNMGSLYAALLKESGQDVSILARGKRLTDIRGHGVKLDNAATRKRTVARVDIVERLDADDAYDLVLVILHVIALRAMFAPLTAVGDVIDGAAAWALLSVSWGCPPSRHAHSSTFTISP